MKNIIIAVAISFSLTACGNADAPPEKEMNTNELVAAAAAGDKDAMRALEKQVVQKAKEEKERMVSDADGGDPLAVFQKALMSGADSAERINALAGEGNPNAQMWNAVSNRQASDLSEDDKEKYRSHMESIAATGDKYKYATVANTNYSLSAEAAFQIAEDKLNAKWLYNINTEDALKYLKQAAEGGHPQAMFKLATRYQYGLDMDTDLAVAKSWLKKSAAAGDRSAKEALANWEK